MGTADINAYESVGSNQAGINMIHNSFINKSKFGGGEDSFD